FNPKRQATVSRARGCMGTAMDFMLIATVIGAAAAVAAALIGWIAYRRSKTQQSPHLRFDAVHLGVDERPQGDPIPKWVKLTLTNDGDGLAQDLQLSAWIFMVKGQRFTVPRDDTLPRPHFTAHETSVRAGESIQTTALRSARAVEESIIPQRDPDAV